MLCHSNAHQKHTHPASPIYTPHTREGPLAKSAVLSLPLPLILRQLSHKNPPPTPSRNSTTPIIPLTNRNPHPPSIPTKPQTRNTPTKLGRIIFYPLSSARVPDRDGSISPARRKGAVDGVEGERVDGVYGA
jgi:hypothetical protein